MSESPGLLSILMCGSWTHAKHLPRALEHVNQSFFARFLHKKKGMTYGPTNQLTDQPTDQPTDGRMSKDNDFEAAMSNCIAIKQDSIS